MIIKPLNNIPFSDIVHCLVKAFSDYSIKMPSEPNYWYKKWETAGVDYELSFGAFEGKQLLGFIINAVRAKDEITIAYNSGTGVLPRSRGRKIPLKIYQFSIPILQEKGVRQLSLEVIDSNEKAIHVYEQIGFSKTRHLHCFKGALNFINALVKIQEIDFQQYFSEKNDLKKYTWDFDYMAIEKGKKNLSFYHVLYKDQNIGGFIINISSKQLCQFYTNRPNRNDFKLLFEGISKLVDRIKLNNVDSSDDFELNNLQGLGLINHVSQYEMTMDL